MHVPLTEGTWPLIALGNIAVLGAFAGYAGGGGLSNCHLQQLRPR